jgi:hypothetical protein
MHRPASLELGQGLPRSTEACARRLDQSCNQHPHGPPTCAAARAGAPQTESAARQRAVSAPSAQLSSRRHVTSAGITYGADSSTILTLHAPASTQKPRSATAGRRSFAAPSADASTRLPVAPAARVTHKIAPPGRQQSRTLKRGKCHRERRRSVLPGQEALCRHRVRPQQAMPAALLECGAISELENGILRRRRCGTLLLY